jgi:hypothetical protein
MADTRHIQTLEDIRGLLGFPGVTSAATLHGLSLGVIASNTSLAASHLATLNTTASLFTSFMGREASNTSQIAGQVALLNTTASLIAYRLPGLRFSHPQPAELFVVAVANPAAGNNTLQNAPVGATANIIHKIRMQFAASHVSPGKDISFRDGTAGSTYFTTRIPQGTSAFEIDLASPIAQTAATAAVCFVATGFSAVGNYEVVLSQKVPSS